MFNTFISYIWPIIIIIIIILSFQTQMSKET